MKKTFIAFVLLFVMAAPSFAQIEEEIANYQPKSESITKARCLMVEKIKQKDFEKVKEIKNYLLEIEDENYIALQPDELCQILLLTKEYDELVSRLHVSGFRSSLENSKYDYYNAHLCSKIYPNLDNLGKQLYETIAVERLRIKCGMDNANLSPEDKDFLAILMEWLVTCSDYSYLQDVEPLPKSQFELNEMATRFLTDYPCSIYNGFVRYDIRKQYGKDENGYGLGIDVCSGLSTGVLSNPVFGFGLSIDFLYKKFDFILGADFMISKTAVDQVYSFEGNSDLVYPKGSWCDWFLPYVNVSYNVLDSKRISISPFIGIGCLYEEYPYNEDKQNEYEDLIKTLLLCKAGSYFDIMLSNNGFEKHVLRIKYEFSLTGVNSGEVSSLHVLSVGWSGLFRGTKRVY